MAKLTCKADAKKEDRAITVPSMTAASHSGVESKGLWPSLHANASDHDGVVCIIVIRACMRASFKVRRLWIMHFLAEVAIASGLTF